MFNRCSSPLLRRRSSSEWDNDSVLLLLSSAVLVPEVHYSGFCGGIPCWSISLATSKPKLDMIAADVLLLLPPPPRPPAARLL